VRFSTSQITIAGVLIGLAALMGLTSVGNIPIPTVGGAITIMHIPVILAGILQGPFMGALVGGIFGACNMFRFPPNDPLVHIPSRIFVGISAALAYAVTRAVMRRIRPSAQTSLAAATAAVVGTLVNTVGTLGMAVLLGYYPPEPVIATALIHCPLEMLVAVIVMVPLTIACNAILHKSPFWE
jgi:uncharacterized membrane protein